MDLALAKTSNSRLLLATRFSALICFLVAGCLLALSLVEAAATKPPEPSAARAASGASGERSAPGT
jgi:hypothetical protein